MSGHVELFDPDWGDEYGPQRDPGDEDAEPNYVATYLPDIPFSVEDA